MPSVDKYASKPTSEAPPAPAASASAPAPKNHPAKDNEATKKMKAEKKGMRMCNILRNIDIYYFTVRLPDVSVDFISFGGYFELVHRIAL